MTDRLGQQMGNYRLTRLLGQGGMAEVYLGEHIYLKTLAALKVLDTELSEQDAASFVQEAQMLARLTHPHIVRVLDFAVKDGTPFLVIEYAPHGTLRQRHPKGTRLPLDIIIPYVQQVTAALQYAHDQQFIHRDVKPENLLLNERFDILLSDFGLGMFARHTLSQSIQQVAGTPFYIAPEQIQGKPRPASDQYALGIVVYEWLTGESPFEGPLMQIVTQHLVAPPPSLRERVPTLSPVIEEVVLRALAKEPKQRFPSVQDFANALQHAAQEMVSPSSTLLSTLAPRAEPSRPFLTPTAAMVQGRTSFEAGILPTLVPLTPGRVPQDTLQKSAQVEQVWQEPTRPTALIGRTTEWTQLIAAWQSASAGRPHLLVLSGEAGIGKTHLAEELLTEIGWQGIATAIARCYAVEGELAYAPVVSWLRAEAFRPALAALDAVWLTEVARLLPDLLARPGLPPPGPMQGDWGAGERQRLFEALARALLGTHGPLLLLLDDLQWCDRETLAWLHFLLRFDPQAPLLIVGTLRSEELTNEHPLQSLLATLRREGQLTQISLERLTAAEAATLAAQLAGRELDAEVATVRLGLGALEDRGWQGSSSAESKEQGAAQQTRLPPTIQAVITARLEQLSVQARELVSMAAVIGRAFSFEVLTATSGWKDEAVIEALDELEQRRIIREQGTDSYDFSHDKLREGAYAALTRARRRLLHRRVADTMERLSGSSQDAYLADLAYHFYEEGAWEKAVAFGQRAGEQAYRLYAPRTVIEQVTRTLDAVQRGSIPPPASLYRLRGRAYETLGDFERARLDYETTLQMARVADNIKGEWQALMDLGFLWAQRDYTQTGIYYLQALALARHMNDPLTLAHSLNRLGNWHLNIEQPREALQYHQEALTIFQHLHDARGIAETLDLLGITSYLGGDLIGGTAYYQQAIALFGELGDKPGLTSSLATLTLRGPTLQTDSLASAASLAEASQDAEHALSIAREIGRRSDEAYALMQMGLSRGSQGNYEHAFEAVKQSLQIAEEIEHRQWMTFGHWELGVLYLDLLALPEARQHLEQSLGLAQEIGSQHWIRVVTAFLAHVYLLQQDFTKTEAVLTAALETDAAMQTIGQRLVWATRAELALARGDPGLALDITERLITPAANLSDEHVIPRLWKLRGEALAALGRIEEAETTLRAAQEAAQVQELRPLLWRIYLALGKLYQTQAREAEAERAFSSARLLIEELAANLPDERMREHFLFQATAMLPRYE
jgi:serine/threonine protein kinase/tetratricopeptide (TPR) repeat protein